MDGFYRVLGFFGLFWPIIESKKGLGEARIGQNPHLALLKQSNRNRKNRHPTYVLEGVPTRICWVCRRLWTVFTVFWAFLAFLGLLLSQKRAWERPRLAKIRT